MAIPPPNENPIMEKPEGVQGTGEEVRARNIWIV